MVAEGAHQADSRVDLTSTSRNFSSCPSLPSCVTRVQWARQGSTAFGLWPRATPRVGCEARQKLDRARRARRVRSGEVLHGHRASIELLRSGMGCARTRIESECRRARAPGGRRRSTRRNRYTHAHGREPVRAYGPRNARIYGALIICLLQPKNEPLVTRLRLYANGSVACRIVGRVTLALNAHGILGRYLQTRRAAGRYTRPTGRRPCVLSADRAQISVYRGSR